MKKIIILLAVVVVLLGAGQFYSASKFTAMLAAGDQAMQKQGFQINKNDVKSGLFNSTVDISVAPKADQAFEIVQHLDVSHLPWGANYTGTIEVIIKDEGKEQRLFTGIMDTDPVIMDGSYNPFSGGSGKVVFAKFKVDADDLHVAMPKPVTINYSHSSDFKIVDNDFLIDSISLKAKDDFAIDAQNIGAQLHQDHVWPDDDFMRSNGVISVAKIALSEPLKQTSIALNASKFDFAVDVNKDGNASYKNQIVVSNFKAENPNKPTINADAKFDVAISAINIKSLRKIIQKFQQTDIADEAAFKTLIDENLADIEAASKIVLQQSKPKIELRELSFNSDNDAMKNLKAKGVMNIFSDKIDIAELMHSNQQMPMGFGIAKYLIDKFDLEFDASGQIQGVLPSAYGDQIKLRVKDGVITINDNVVPF